MRTIAEQIAETYRRMATEARYRPMAPSDGLGNITAPLEQLDLDAEAERYAARWRAEEDDGTYLIGSVDHHARPAMIFALEAARLCACGSEADPFALDLARLAVAELERLVSDRGAGGS